jgi:ketosteroid isomerase-like protein
MKHIADDLVSFDLAPPLQHCGAAHRALQGLADRFDTWDGPVVWSNHELKIEIGGGIAFGPPHGRHEEERRACRSMVPQPVCLTRHDGAWKITHQHRSVPFYTDGATRPP